MTAMRIPKLAPASQDADQRALYAEIAEGPRARGAQHFALTDEEGALNGPFNAFLLAPELGRSLQAVGAAVRYSTALSPRVRELAILVVAAHWGSTFERDAHESVGRAVGLTDAELTEVRNGRVPDGLAVEERAAVDLVRALVAGDISDEEWTRWAVPLGDVAVFELSTLVGYYATLALQLRIFRVE